MSSNYLCGHPKLLRLREGAGIRFGCPLVLRSSRMPNIAPGRPRGREEGVAIWGGSQDSLGEASPNDNDAVFWLFIIADPMRTLAISLLTALFCIPAHADLEQIEEATKLRSGLALVLDGPESLARDFARSGRWLVHLLVDEEAEVEAVTRELTREGLGGRVLVTKRRSPDLLPHPDRFVNLIVTSEKRFAAQGNFENEALRVLAVRGAIWAVDEGKERLAGRAVSAPIDGWFSRWYDATGNSVSRDRVAAFPHAVQWQHGPAMEDGTADGKIMRVAAGRVVYLGARDGVLYCRDAGNGTLLWERFVGSKQNDDIVICADRIHLWHDPQAKPDEDHKRLGERGRLTAFDLATGKLVQTYDQGLAAGTAVPVKWSLLDERGNMRTRSQSPVPWFTVNEQVVVQAYGSELIVLDRKSGALRWRKKCDAPLTWFSPVVNEGVLIAYELAHPARRSRHDGSSRSRAITCYDLKTGERLWHQEGIHRDYRIEGKTRVYTARAEVKPLAISGEDVLVQTASYQFRQGGSVAVLDLRTGKERWYRRFKPKERYTHGSFRAVLRGREVVLMCGLGMVRFDRANGKIFEEIKPPRAKREARPNGACAASRATDNLLVANSYLYLANDDDEPQVNFGARSACGQGMVPAHGLIFVTPTPCDCGDYTRGYQALAPRVAGLPIPDDQRLVTGPGKPGKATSRDWSHFLGNPTRNSVSRAELPDTLHPRWQVQLCAERIDDLQTDRRQSERWIGELTAPTATDQLAVVGLPERHELVGINLADGSLRWRTPTIGKVDSPPTLAGGLAVFGSDGGYVTALSLENGELAWRFRATPTDGLAMSHGHLASTHPVPGSVLVLDDRVIAVAGHHTDLGGLHVWALDLGSGKVLARRHFDASGPEVVANGITRADDDGMGFWIGSFKSSFHLSATLEDLPESKETKGPPLSFDRNGTRIRFRTADGRGGSTHGWKQAMQALTGGVRAHRVALSGGIAYAVQDPTSRARHPGSAATSTTLMAMKGSWREKDEVWSVSQAALGNPESISALIKVADRLYLAGGTRDGSAGFLQVINATTGTLLGRHELPARVTECGLAAAGGKLLVCCENGTIVAFGKGD